MDSAINLNSILLLEIMGRQILVLRQEQITHAFHPIKGSNAGVAVREELAPPRT